MPLKKVNSMNLEKINESIEIFKSYFVDNRKFYESDERNWKVKYCKKFQKVFSHNNITSKNFHNSLRDLFKDSKIQQTVNYLAGGAFYQCQRFIDFLESNPDNEFISNTFKDLFYSKESIKRRINKFKKKFDSAYKKLAHKSNIQLNLISQFLGLSNVGDYYIFKDTELNKSCTYFEYKPILSDKSAGGKYEYYYKFMNEIKLAMVNAGLKDIDFIDVHTFIYREDWYTPSSFDQEQKKFDDETNKAENLPIEKLVVLAEKSKPQPSRIIRGIYRYRDPNIAALTKIDASGMCELCNKEAPFKNLLGFPYLECHHIKHLANKGKDEVKNCVALCPNCHTKMHVLNLEIDRKKLFTIATERYERLFVNK
jgi:5-methylcytosine-specific restriction endonuclease McrA